MAGRLVNLVHAQAEDRLRPNGRVTGQAVTGHATFYVPDSGWVKIPPGRLDVAELWGGASGFPNQERSIAPAVEFYIQLGANRAASFVALNGDTSDYFTFGFFGRRYS